jgi:hypothetical protein
MRTIILATALAAVLAGPALAASHTPHQLRHDRQVMDSNAAMLTNDPIGVYVNGKEVGRDPDPNIREEIQREYYTLQGE